MMEDQSESLAGAQRSEYEWNSHDSSLNPCDSSEAVRGFSCHWTRCLSYLIASVVLCQPTTDMPEKADLMVKP
jgi:hypothetical protein